MKHLILLLVATTLSQFGFSQNRAPSCWLKYQDHFQGDILINTVKVQSPSPTYTYYCNLQWNAGMEGGGYCGIQEHPGGRNFIFSIWDPKASTDAITAPYTHNGTEIENFGGEGTGLKSWNFDIGWDTDQWYSFVTRAWDANTHTMFGYWVFNHTDQEWYHLVTMDYPVPNVRFNSSTGSFIEDWLGNGSNTREVHHKEGWKRKTSDLSWNPLTNSFFERVSPDAGAANYIDNYDGGVATDHYFMKSGGTVSPVTNTSNTMLSLSNSNSAPGFITGEVTQLNTTINGSFLTLDWNVNESKSPQFSYNIAIYDNPTFTGSPIIQLDQNVPHQRTSDIDMSSLIVGNDYYIQFYIIDIFDNQSSPLSDSFTFQPTTSSFSITECTSYTVPSMDTTYTTVGTYAVMDTIPNTARYDSVMTINITIFSPLTGAHNETVCFGESIVVNGTTYDTSNLTGTEVFTNIGANSCDSTVAVNLTVLPQLTEIHNETVCFGESIVVNGTTYDTNNLTGTEVFTNIGANNCDSTVAVNLTVLPQLTGTHNETVCFGESIVVNGTTYDASNLTGTEVFTNIGANSCDSTVAVNLTVQSIDTSTTTSGSTITSNQTGATYQWINCNDGNSIITGETNQNYTAATDNGVYAVIITMGNCSYTSACVNILTVGINNISLFNNVSIYPNPSQGIINIELGTLKNVTVKVFRATGQLVYNKGNINTSKYQFELNEDAGIYFVEVSADNERQKYKLIIK